MIARVFALLLSLSLIQILPAVAADPPSLAPDKILSGEISGKPVEYLTVQGPRTGAYSTKIPVSIKAGSAFQATVTIKGDGRGVMLVLLDPTDTPVANTGFARPLVPNDTLKVKEVAATGIYTLQILTTQIGAYEVKANFEENTSESLLLKRVEAAEKELAEAKKAVEAYKVKNKQK
jgi:hypothetical protein